MLIYDRKNIDGVLNFDCIEYIHLQEVDSASRTTWRVIAVGASKEEYILARGVTEAEAEDIIDEIMNRKIWGDKAIDMDDIVKLVLRSKKTLKKTEAE